MQGVIKSYIQKLEIVYALDSYEKVSFKGEVEFINYLDKPSRLILSDSGNMGLSHFHG